MDEIILVVILLGYVLNFLTGLLVMSNEKAKELVWLLIPFYFIYFIFKNLDE